MDFQETENHETEKGPYMTTRKQALRAARRFRTCPPAHVRALPRHREAYRYHQTICPHCGDPAEDGSAPWDRLLGRLREAAGPGAAPEDPPFQPGQLRWVRADLGRWSGGFFFNPPRVLLLRHLSPSGRFQVAQTHFDALLAGPGDLILGPDGAGGFIETWNIYPLPAGLLGPMDGTVPRQVLEAARRMADGERAAPDWAPLPVPLSGDDDPRRHFRDLERSVARIFATEAGAGVGGPEPSGPTIPEILRDLAQAAPDAYLDAVPETPEAALTAIRFEPDRLALAAGDRDGPVPFANLITLRAGALEGVAPAPVHLFDRVREGGTLTVDGRIAPLPGGLAGSRFIAHLKAPSGPFRPPAEVRWDPGTGSFLVRFDLTAEEEEAGEGELLMAVVREAEDG